MDTKLDWSAYSEQGMGDAYAGIPKHGGDFAKAVAVCINSGHCEREQRGVMCPSFRISQDPQQSPRGRVKLLKQWLNRDPKAKPDPQLQQALAQSMDSCVACKGCKRECESNLDIAQIKQSLTKLRLVEFQCHVGGFPGRGFLTDIPGADRNRHGKLAKPKSVFPALDIVSDTPE